MRSKYFDELGLSEYPYPYNQEGYPTVDNQEECFADKRDTYSLN